VDLPPRARSFASEAYSRQNELAHPEEVEDLVRRAGADEDVRAAALLHDLVEDTDVQTGEIAREFGSHVAAYVAAMTEDTSIEDYLDRKDEHRHRARDAGREVALLFVADKLSNVRRMKRGQKKPDLRKVEHYRATLELMRERYPDLPLLDELEDELQLREAAGRRRGAPDPQPSERG
jgi:(p)ppGpp synthase/HD superfamily hydrolase